LTAPVAWTAAAADSRLWGAVPDVRAAFAAGGGIAYNAHSQGFTPADELALRAAGARAIIRKPFTLRAVVELINARAAMAG
jgi:hypothetical protein